MDLSAKLTKQQNRVVIGLVLGMCHKEIADALNIKPKTAENHIDNAKAKAQVKKSTDLVVFWMVKHFSIPFEALPKSMTAIVFLILFCSYEMANTRQDVFRTPRTVRIGRRNDNLPVIEL